MFDTILKIMLFLSPVFYTVGFTGMASSNEIFFKIFILTLFLASLLSEKVREVPKDVTRFIIALFCLFGINTFIHNFGMAKFDTIFNYGLIILGFVLVVQYTRNVKECSKYIVYGVIANLLLANLQYMGWGIIFPEGGFFGNKTRFGPYLAILMPLFFVLKNKIMIYLLLINCLLIALSGDAECTVLLSFLIVVTWRICLRYGKASGTHLRFGPKLGKHLLNP